MRMLPLSCVRPRPERVEEALSLELETKAQLEAACAADGPFQADASRAVYLCEARDMAGRVVTGIVCCCSVDELADGTLTCSASLRPANEAIFEAQAEVGATHIDELGAQDAVVTLLHPDNFALDVIVTAAKTATPLYELPDAEGGSTTIWRVSRPEAVEALRTTFETIAHAQVVDAESHLAAEAAERLAARRRARATNAADATEHTSRMAAGAAERFPVLLVPANQVSGAAPTLPRGLFLHRV